MQSEIIGAQADVSDGLSFTAAVHPAGPQQLPADIHVERIAELASVHLDGFHADGVEHGAGFDPFNPRPVVVQLHPAPEFVESARELHRKAFAGVFRRTQLHLHQDLTRFHLHLFPIQVYVQLN